MVLLFSFLSRQGLVVISVCVMAVLILRKVGRWEAAQPPYRIVELPRGMKVVIRRRWDAISVFAACLLLYFLSLFFVIFRRGGAGVLAGVLLNLKRAPWFALLGLPFAVMALAISFKAATYMWSILSVAWRNTLGEEELSFDEENLSIKRIRGLKSRSWSYRLSGITGLRVSRVQSFLDRPPGRSSHPPAPERRAETMKRHCLEFLFEGRPARLGEGLREDDAEGLLREIASRYPALVPEGPPAPPAEERASVQDSVLGRLH